MSFVKGMFVALWERVIVNWKPTLYGLGFSAAAFAVEYAGNYFGGLPTGWAKYVAMIAVPVGAWLKSRAAAYPHPVA